jgi:hypothetical protein
LYGTVILLLAGVPLYGMAGPSAPFFQALALSYALAGTGVHGRRLDGHAGALLPAACQCTGRHRSVRARPCAGARALGPAGAMGLERTGGACRRRAHGRRHARVAAGAARRRAAGVPRTQSRDPVGWPRPGRHSRR